MPTRIQGWSLLINFSGHSFDQAPASLLMPALSFPMLEACVRKLDQAGLRTPLQFPVAPGGGGPSWLLELPRNFPGILLSDRQGSRCVPMQVMRVKKWESFLRTLFHRALSENRIVCSRKTRSHTLVSFSLICDILPYSNLSGYGCIKLYNSVIRE